MADDQENDSKTDSKLSERIGKTLNKIDNSVKNLDQTIERLDTETKLSQNKIRHISTSGNANDEKQSLLCMNEIIENGFSFDKFIDYETVSKIQLSKYNVGIPRGLQGLKQLLINKNGYETEGIFRVRGNELKLNAAKKMLKNGEIAIKDLDCTTIEIAQLIKAWFREVHVDEPGWITKEMLDTSDEKEVLGEFDKFYEPRRSIMLWIIDFWIEIEQYSDYNRMTISTLATIFSPNLIRCDDKENPMAFLTLQKRAQRVLEQLTMLRKNNELKQNINVEYKELFVRQNDDNSKQNKENAEIPVEYVQKSDKKKKIFKNKSNNSNNNNKSQNQKDRCILQ